MIPIHNHAGYSNCPRCVARIRELESWLNQAKQHIRELEAELAQRKELPSECCPTCGDILHSGLCREFDPKNEEDWESLPKTVRELILTLSSKATPDEVERLRVRVAELAEAIARYEQETSEKIRIRFPLHLSEARERGES